MVMFKLVMLIPQNKSKLEVCFPSGSFKSSWKWCCSGQTSEAKAQFLCWWCWAHHHVGQTTKEEVEVTLLWKKVCDTLAKMLIKGALCTFFKRYNYTTLLEKMFLFSMWDFCHQVFGDFAIHFEPWPNRSQICVSGKFQKKRRGPADTPTLSVAFLGILQ